MHRGPRVRLATEPDADAIGRIVVRAWQAAYGGRIPDDYLGQLDPTTRARQWRENIARGDRAIFVSERNEAAVGFCSLGSCRDDDLSGERVGEITAIYVDPEHWREGHGRALMSAVLPAARRAGFRAVTLWVLESNRGAEAFYVALGFVPDGAKKLDMQFGIELHHVRYRLRVPSEA